jgi:hypothetical protein
VQSGRPRNAVVALLDTMTDETMNTKEDDRYCFRLRDRRTFVNVMLETFSSYAAR